MNSRLEEAFRRLELQDLRGGPPLERYPDEVWQFIYDKFPDFAPRWYRELTERFRIGGADFVYPIDNERDYLGHCTVMRPSFALHYFYFGYPFPRLYEQNYFCFAEADDGNMWIFRNDSGDDPEVLFLESTAWDGGEVTTENGLICPKVSLSQFLTYGADWRPDDEEQIGTEQDAAVKIQQ